MSTAALYVTASFSGIHMYADSAYYFFNILKTGTFYLVEPTARTTQIFQQLPVVMLIKAGVSDKHVLSVIFSATLLFLPLLMTILCYFILPGKHKSFVFFPAVHFAFGTLASFFPVVTDAPVAAGYFWILLFLIIFRYDSFFSRIFVFLLSLPALFLHEAYSFLAPVLFLALILRLMRISDFKITPVTSATMAWYLILASVQLHYIFNPRSEANKSSFVDQLLRLEWLFKDGINISSLMGLLFLSFLFFLFVYRLFFYQRYKSALFLRILFCLFTFTALFVLGFVFYDFKNYAVLSQFAARSNSALISFPLSLAAVVIYFGRINLNPFYAKNTFYALTLCFVVIISAHFVGVAKWSGYLMDFRGIVHRNIGFIPYRYVLDSLGRMDSFLFRKMTFGWTNTTMSLLLAGANKPKAILLNPEGHWNPFEPCENESLVSYASDYNTEILSNTLDVKGCDFLTEEKVSGLSMYVDDGFYSSEGGHIWSKKNSLLVLPEGSAVKTIHFYSLLEKTEIAVTVNKDTAFRRVTPVDLDVSRYTGDGYVYITLEADKSGVPRNMGINNDTRELSFALKLTM